MISVLLSVQPEWVDKICNVLFFKDGLPVYEKEDEVRKTRPSVSVPFKVYIYESRRRKKVIGHFICDRIAEIYPFEHAAGVFFNTFGKTGLSLDEYEAYAGGKKVYFWHISALNVYDKPRELSEFITPTECKSGVAKDMMCNTCCLSAEFCSKKPKRITRPPQSWCYVWEEGT